MDNELMSNEENYAFSVIYRFGKLTDTNKNEWTSS